MILFLIFVSIFLGFNVRYYLLPIGIISLAFLIYVFIRFKKKAFLITLIFLSSSIGVSYINISFSTTKFEGMVLESKENYFILTNGLEKFYVYEKDNNREVGDILSIKGEKEELNFQRVESSFDFKDYLNKKGITYSIKNPEITVKFPSLIKSKYFKKKFLSHFKSDTASFLSLLLFSSDYEGEDAKMMEGIQLNRLMSTSGIYLHAISSLIIFLLSFFIKEKHSKWVAFIFISVFGIFLFPKFNVVRFCVFTLFSLINEHFLKGKISYLDRISIIGILFLLFDPHLAYQDSFVIGFFLPITIHFIRFSFNKEKWYIKPIFFALSLYVFMIPFTLKFNNFINLFSLLLQTTLSPLFIVFYVVSYIGFLGLPIYQIIEFFYTIIHEILKITSRFSLNIHSPSFSFVSLLIFETLYFSFHYYYSICFKPVYKRILLVFIGFLTVNFLPVENLLTQEVSFINIGQGDATLIRKGSVSVLVDTGGSLYQDLANESLIPYFRKKRIYDIDALVITHNDFDHNGAASSLCENFKVKQILDKKSDFPYKIGGITLYNLNKENYNNDNENSLVLYFSMWGKKFLIMGDASIEVEKQILLDNPNLDCDILRVGHHGSNTSTLPEFISKITPSESIISVGKNYYGHPHKEVIYTLEKYNVRIRRTDLEGTITYSNYIFM